jgi:hypothetical protein
LLGGFTGTGHGAAMGTPLCVHVHFVMMLVPADPTPQVASTSFAPLGQITGGPSAPPLSVNWMEQAVPGSCLKTVSMSFALALQWTVPMGVEFSVKVKHPVCAAALAAIGLIESIETANTAKVRAATETGARTG